MLALVILLKMLLGIVLAVTIARVFDMNQTAELVVGIAVGLSVGFLLPNSLKGGD